MPIWTPQRGWPVLSTLFVHAEHKEPKDLRGCHEESDGNDRGIYAVGKRGRQEGQPAHACNHA
jgi:hypothetical protein